MARTEQATAEDLVEPFERFIEEVWNEKQPAKVDDIFAEDYVNHGAQPPNREGLKNRLDRMLAAFPDIHVAVDDVLVEGDKLGVRLTVTGTHEGPFMGVAPTGEKVAFRVCSILRVEDGRIVEQWDSADLFTAMVQIGGIELPGPPAE